LQKTSYRVELHRDSSVARYRTEVVHQVFGTRYVRGRTQWRSSVLL